MRRATIERFGSYEMRIENLPRELWQEDQVTQCYH